MSNLLPEKDPSPSIGAYSVSIQEYLESQDDWVDKNILKLHKTNPELASQVIKLAKFSEEKQLTNAQTIFLSTCLIIDAFSRDITGHHLDKTFDI